MKRFKQLSITLFGLLLAMPLRAQLGEAEEVQRAVGQFLKNKQVTLTEGSYSLKEDDFTFLKDSAMCVQFICNGEKPLKQLIHVFDDNSHFAEFYRCYLGVGSEMTRALRTSFGPKIMEKDKYYVLIPFPNTRIIVFGNSGGLQQGFVLQWEDLSGGKKKGSVCQFLGYNMEIVTPVTENDRVTMDSVRTAIKIGEALKNRREGAMTKVDTTYIDGKWAVSTDYHLTVLREMDGISDYNDGMTSLYMKVEKLAEMSKDATDKQLASIGFALKREASRYERLLTPEEFSSLWKCLFYMETKAEHFDTQLANSFKASESILREKINESVRLEFHDTKRHQFLKNIGFTVTKNEGGRWYYAVYGKHYTGNPILEYLDGCADEEGTLHYHAQRVETGLQPGIYRLTAAGRASGDGGSGAYIFAKTEKELMLEEIPACDDHGGSIWQEAALRVKEASNNGTQVSPQDVRIVLANGGLGYGWNKIVINNIIVRDGRLTYGVSSDPDFTGKPFLKKWLSAVDFVLERTGDLP